MFLTSWKEPRRRSEMLCLISLVGRKKLKYLLTIIARTDIIINVRAIIGGEKYESSRET